MATLHEDDPFVRAMLADPENDAPRLIYADWLEERSDPRGEYLRLQCYLASLDRTDPQFDRLVGRFRELLRQISPRWRAAVCRSKVEGCRFSELGCPNRWDKLRPTNDSSVRYCATCREEVYYCYSIREAFQLVDRGRCVVIDIAEPRHEGDLRGFELHLEEDEQHDNEFEPGSLVFPTAFHQFLQTHSVDDPRNWGPNPDEADDSFVLAPPRERRRPWWRFW